MGRKEIRTDTVSQVLYIFTSCLVSNLFMGTVEMENLKHMVVVKFKEGVVVEDMVKDMEKLVSEIDTVKSFEWGADMGSQEMLRQGFTHIFSMEFGSQEDFTTYLSHPSHVEFSTAFSSAIEKILVFDFPAVVVKRAPA